jgi:hypothetical protein
MILRTLSGALLGLTLDYLFSGVLKVIWFLIYAPFYAAIGNALYMQLRKSSFKESSLWITSAFFIGAALGHVTFTAYTRRFNYSMSLQSLNPTTLNSSEWPQKLILISDPVTAALVKIPPKGDIPVVIEDTLDYGCVRRSKIVSVAGVDISNDAASSWTWKKDHSYAVQIDPVQLSGPGNEDQNLPWCLLQFYRSAL